MQDLHFVSEDYEKRKSKDYRLSISIRRDGFSFLLSSKRAIVAYSYITVPENQRNTAFKEFLSQEILQDTFSAVSIIIVTPSFTCVPKKLYDDSMWEDYSNLNFEHSGNESVITYESLNTDVVVLFPIDTELWALCRSAFKNQEFVSYIPQVAPMLESNVKSRGERLFVFVEQSFFTVLYVSKKNMQFCNSFGFTNVNDFLFYLMNVMKQLNLDPLRIQVELAGKISVKSSYFSAIQMFVKNVSVVENATTMKNFPYMLFYNHCNVALCE
ncbi:MAG: DUF3822 family protein [Bacteroidales bacterium]|nr:DUF3822 family protein [Bacteroidales bacterium]